MSIVNAFRSPISVREHSVYLPISVSISSYEASKSQAEMMRDTDTAMYDAKAKSGNRFSMSTQEIRTDARARLDLEQSLHKAVDRGGIKTYYQPIVSARSGDIYALEALIRWQRPSGMVPPGHFLAIAEATGLIVPIGNELIRQTLRFARTLNNQGNRALKFNINLSAVQLLDDSTYDTLFREIEANALPYSQICLEVTEQSQIVDEERILDGIGFDYYQGFHFSRPVSPEDMLAYLDARAPRLMKNRSPLWDRSTVMSQ